MDDDRKIDFYMMLYDTLQKGRWSLFIVIEL